MEKLDELNGADQERAVSLLAPLIERAPDIARRVARRRPFKSADDLCQSIRDELLGLNQAERLSLFRAHPELSPENPLSMTSESQSEQGRLNLTSDGNDYRVLLDQLNAQYREKFGFPFITALVRHPDMDSVFSEFETRLSADLTSEIAMAIDQIAEVSASRVSAVFGCRTSDGSQDSAAGG
ncbi:MAG: 2-oxo-4-hydroxy-4-carboxy-5-ureidoimidazoline decarboxylase [Alphaproteobacteria bacterium]|nr:2-oxo-4-hydroxy-4-carboxy-5-ureidoimidazoline decarboxylase [Alphaproteobacteria bacterium]